MIKVSFAQKPISLIEREAAFSASGAFKNRPGVLLQTCNRIEFYEGEGCVQEDQIRHLFRVVSGLESNMLGEVAIQGQVKTAYMEACGKFRLSRELHWLFQTALFVGKRVRTESGISRGAMSHSQAAVEIICKSGINLDKALISIIGAHKLNEDIIRFLKSKGAETIFLGNKSFEKAQTIAEKFNCETFRLDQLTDFLSFTDILISATSAPHTIVDLAVFPKGKRMLIVDLAVPRDIDERIGNIEGVTLYNIESIENAVSQNIDTRKCEIIKAEQIIEEEIEKFFRKQEKYVAVTSGNKSY